ncbi:MAG: hypothetical protein ABW026_03035 [Microvirga sp.]
MEKEIEAVARAFYDVLEPGQSWDSAPETIRSLLRDDARTAIASLEVPFTHEAAFGPLVLNAGPLSVRGSTLH